MKTARAAKAVYRYEIAAEVLLDELEETIVLALLGAEALHGEAVVRLDAKHFLDEASRVLVVDATAPAGRDFNRLLAGFLSRQFGPDSFSVALAEPRPRAAKMRDDARSAARIA